MLGRIFNSLGIKFNLGRGILFLVCIFRVGMLFLVDLDGLRGDKFLENIKRKEIPLLRRKLGIVFQDFKLLIDRTVDANLEFALKATGWKNKEAVNQEE